MAERRRKEQDGTHRGGPVDRAALTAANNERGRPDPNSKRTKNRQRLGLPGNRGDRKAGKRRGR